MKETNLGFTIGKQKVLEIQPDKDRDITHQVYPSNIKHQFDTRKK